MIAVAVRIVIDADTGREAQDVITRILMDAAKLAMNGVVDWSFPAPAREVEEVEADYQPTAAFLPF